MVRWKIIEEFPNYEISDSGLVRSNTQKGKGKGMILKSSITRGYCRVQLRHNNIQKSKTIHRLVAKSFIQMNNHKPQINHIDCNKLNNNYGNLEWCTHKENHQHADENGLRNGMKGESHPNCKFNASIIESIRFLYNECGWTTGRLARSFDTNYKYIWKIVNRKVWKHI